MGKKPTRQERARLFWDRSSQLAVTDKHYQDRLLALFRMLVLDDAGKGDVTTGSLVDENRTVCATAVAKSGGVIAGIEEARLLLSSDAFGLDALRARFFVKDGETVLPGQRIAEVKGNARLILQYERHLLNIMQRMSGIASQTGKMVDVSEQKCYVIGTRKTLWNLLDKKAISVGGGLTHRLNLEDGVLIKENHLEAMGLHGTGVTSALKEASEKTRSAFIEIETETDEQVFACCEWVVDDGKSYNRQYAVMFDNRTPQEISVLLKELKEKGLYDAVLFEASGGINEESFCEYAKSGVDVISLGMLTHSVKAFDISLRFDWQR